MRCNGCAHRSLPNIWADYAVRNQCIRVSTKIAILTNTNQYIPRLQWGIEPLQKSGDAKHSSAPIRKEGEMKYNNNSVKIDMNHRWGHTNGYVPLCIASEAHLYRWLAQGGMLQISNWEVGISISDSHCEQLSIPTQSRRKCEAFSIKSKVFSDCVPMVEQNSQLNSFRLCRRIFRKAESST